MSYTKFGEYIRILRIKNHEVMGDTAKFLEVSTPFLSSVENGKKNVPMDWYGKIVNHYNLNEEERDMLKKAIEDSKTQIKLNLVSTNECKRQAALAFQRSFDELDDETAKNIIKLLNNSKKVVD